MLSACKLTTICNMQHNLSYLKFNFFFSFFNGAFRPNRRFWKWMPYVSYFSLSFKKKKRTKVSSKVWLWLLVSSEMRESHAYAPWIMTLLKKNKSMQIPWNSVGIVLMDPQPANSVSWLARKRQIRPSVNTGHFVLLIPCWLNAWSFLLL